MMLTVIMTKKSVDNGYYPFRSDSDELSSRLAKLVQVKNRSFEKQAAKLIESGTVTIKTTMDEYSFKLSNMGDRQHAYN